MASDGTSGLVTLVVLIFGRICPTIIAYYALKFLYQAIYYRFFHELRKFPGPFWASATRLYITYWNLKETEHEHMLDLHRKYGASALSKEKSSSRASQAPSSESPRPCWWLMMQPSCPSFTVAMSTSPSITSLAVLARRKVFSTCRTIEPMLRTES